jgi:hypothetical protein
LPLELDVPLPTGAQADEEAPVHLAGTPLLQQQQQQQQQLGGQQQPEPMFYLQTKGAGSNKVKNRLRGQAGPYVGSFDFAPNCPPGSALRLFAGGRCHSSLKLGGLKASLLHGEPCEFA